MARICVYADGTEVEVLRRLVNAHEGRMPGDTTESLLAAAVLVINELNESIEKFYLASTVSPLD